ncbi:MAG: DUF5060 domain-containing protein [Bacteroidales bacterium]|nr:DUF5060 domain-containing protein [Bacteroidales bacterium]
MKRNKGKSFYTGILYLLLIVHLSCGGPNEQTYHLWNKHTFLFIGPELTEEQNTYLNYKLQVYFTHKASGKVYNIPGFYAADGNASETSSTEGNAWKVHFVPDETGEWTYEVSFRKGDKIAISLAADQGESAGYFDGETGKFTVTMSGIEPKSRDFRGKGMLRYVEKHYLQHAGNGQYFIKGGAGSPENFLAYSDFDGTFDNGGTTYPALGDNQLHEYLPHLKDWRPGDPVWKDTLGKTIIGAVNYIAVKGLNAVYIVTMNVKGDGEDVWPWTTPDSRTVFDVSKLEQWEIVFDHMDKQGIMKDILLTETENENLFEALDGGDFAFTRKLYYREMVARFGHHLGISWNLGEENGHNGTGETPYKNPNTDEQRKMFCIYLRSIDAYKHHIVVHNWPDDEEILYAPLLGFSSFEGVSLQLNDNYYNEVLKWVNASDLANHPWIVAVDEPLGWEFGLRPDKEDPEHNIPRTDVLWPVLFAGGAGTDWYFGWQNNAPTSDLSNEDWRSRNNMWEQTRIALDFFETYLPFHEMKAANYLCDNSDALVFAKENEIYAIYMKDPDAVQLNLGKTNKKYSIRWYDPRKGGDLQAGTVDSVLAEGTASTGLPPDNRNKDWICLLRVSD